MDSTGSVTKPDTVESVEDTLGIASGFDDFDSLGVAAEAAQAQRKRFLLICDATSSMSTWWAQAQTALKKAVDEISSKSNTPFQVKVVAYRDHTCDEKPLEESNWSNNTDYLKKFIEGIVSKGGGDHPESVGRGLACALQTNACLVILIGDAPGRPESQGFEEATQLGQSKCPVYALYTDTYGGVKESFERIASLSGGKAMLLRDAKNMTDIFSALLAKMVFQIAYQATSIEAKKIMEEK